MTSGSSQKVKLEGEKTFLPSRRQQRPETAPAGPGRGCRLRRSRPPGKPAARGHRSRRPQAPRPRPPRRAATTRVLAAAGAGLAVDRQLVHIMTLRGRTRWGHARRRSHVPPQAAHLGSAGASRLRTAPWGNRHPGEGNSNAALLRTWPLHSCGRAGGPREPVHHLFQLLPAYRSSGRPSAAPSPAAPLA